MEYKVKGQTIDGQWVEGFLIKNPYGDYYIYKENNYFDVLGHTANREDRIVMDVHKIIRETIEKLT